VRAVLHDMVPAAGMGAETYALHDVWVMEASGDAEFRLDFLLIFILILLLSLLPKLLDSIDMVRRATLPDHQFDRRGGAFADHLSPLPGQNAWAGELFRQLDGIHIEIVR